MNEICNTHYNIMDTLIHFDKSTWNKALEIVNGHDLKAKLNIEFAAVHYQDYFVLEIAQKLHDETNLPMYVCATFADCAIWAVIHKYRHEPS